jgi:hypothetical protein
MEQMDYAERLDAYMKGEIPTTDGSAREELRTALYEIAEELNCTPRRPGGIT